MSWTSNIEINGLTVKVFGDYIGGESIGLSPQDDAIKNAIKQRSPAIFDILDWIASDDAKDFCIARWANDGVWWDHIRAYDNYLEIVRSITHNHHANDKVKQFAHSILQKANQQAVKSILIKKRRAEFSAKRNDIVLALMARDGYLCSECGDYEHLAIDHIIPLSRGGSDELSNLRFLCQKCNSKKGDR